MWCHWPMAQPLSPACQQILLWLVSNLRRPGWVFPLTTCLGRHKQSSLKEICPWMLLWLPDRFLPNFCILNELIQVIYLSYLIFFYIYCICGVHFSQWDLKHWCVFFLLLFFVGALPTSSVDGKNLDHVCCVEPWVCVSVCVCVCVCVLKRRIVQKLKSYFEEVDQIFCFYFLLYCLCLCPGQHSDWRHASACVPSTSDEEQVGSVQALHYGPRELLPTARTFHWIRR